MRHHTIGLKTGLYSGVAMMALLPAAKSGLSATSIGSLNLIDVWLDSWKFHYPIDMDNKATIRFFKESGKHYASCEIDMENVEPWDNKKTILRQIAKNQREVGSIEDFYIVLGDTENNYRRSEYYKTWSMLIKPEGGEK